jgi:hypothetical protein
LTAGQDWYKKMIMDENNYWDISWEEIEEDLVPEFMLPKFSEKEKDRAEYLIEEFLEDFS